MYILSTLYSILLLIVIWYRKRYFYELYSKVTFISYADEEFFIESDTNLKQLIQFTGPLIVISYTGIICYPVLNAAFADISIGSPSTFIYLSWYPWTVDAPSKYVCTIFLQMCSATLLCSVISSVILFVVYCNVIIKSHLNALKRIVKSIERNRRRYLYTLIVDSNEMNDLITDEYLRKRKSEYNRYMLNEINCVVKHHLNFIR